MEAWSGWLVIANVSSAAATSAMICQIACQSASVAVRTENVIATLQSILRKRASDFRPAHRPAA